MEELFPIGTEVSEFCFLDTACVVHAVLLFISNRSLQRWDRKVKQSVFRGVLGMTRIKVPIQFSNYLEGLSSLCRKPVEVA